MENIPINKVKQIREEFGLTHIVIFGMIEGENNFVATHGKTAIQAKEAAQYGNNLKGILGWPLQLCRAEPLKRVCKNCSFWQREYCMFKPEPIRRGGLSRACGEHFEPNK
ncbi:hypothetical protein [uncultured Sunxiuqinia sp.]|uniref:hypothetical protein n=1 Tax=uncultured Sunxiuqinia sp. TaxID=1573825 RepID=UPI002620E665|nr:hypothetical protein [uncultured Sunxiuqinia sp.]